MAGVMDREDKVAELTIRIVLPEEPVLEKLLGKLEVAVMVVVPEARAVTRPLALIVATETLDELQVTSVVASWVVWSFK